MSLTYKLNQLLNVFERRRNRTVSKWGFIYGVPRSGTSFVFHAFLRQARTGISDWELVHIQNCIETYEDRSHISLDSEKLANDMVDNIILNGQPGGGRTYDLIIKQIHTNQRELDFLIKTLGSEPAFKLFIYRRPENWYSSAQKKFGLTDAELLVMYQQSLNSFFEIGGEVTAYEQIPSNDWLKSKVGSLTDFDARGGGRTCPKEFEQAYQAFTDRLAARKS